MGYDAGYLLFAERCFCKEDIITVYFGKKLNPRSIDESRCLKIRCKVVDVEHNFAVARPLYFGGHFSNPPYFHIVDIK